MAELNRCGIAAVLYAEPTLQGNAAICKRQEGARAFKKAINRNLSYMHRLLDEDQYREYVKLLNVTLNNRGLNDK